MFASLIPALLLVPAVLGGPFSLPVLLPRDEGAVSPNKTCGVAGAGQNRGESCPQSDACCSSYGYCGTGDMFCLTTGGCQAKYSNSSSACVAPKSGQTISIDGTCGTTGAGKAGYKCPTTGLTCCSVAYVPFFFFFFFLAISVLVFNAYMDRNRKYRVELKHSVGYDRPEANSSLLGASVVIPPTTATSTTVVNQGSGLAPALRNRPCK